ncbi:MULTISPECIES: hypothetical protein [unclassified Burkholderia]|uniref:hypothetical protein n=1 Tax=unclassified Burkholderia TaxID=2613784 RepID=UPI001F04EA15|nr:MULTISPECIES: hypothetical protein [unclassified Burkholderia]
MPPRLAKTGRVARQAVSCPLAGRFAPLHRESTEYGKLPCFDPFAWRMQRTTTCTARPSVIPTSTPHTIDGGVIVIRVERDLLGRLRIRVHGQQEMLPVSRAYAGLFRQM